MPPKRKQAEKVGGVRQVAPRASQRRKLSPSPAATPTPTAYVPPEPRNPWAGLESEHREPEQKATPSGSGLHAHDHHAPANDTSAHTASPGQPSTSPPDASGRTPVNNTIVSTLVCRVVTLFIKT